jgi:hypothetical protein
MVQHLYRFAVHRHVMKSSVVLKLRIFEDVIEVLDRGEPHFPRFKGSRKFVKRAPFDFNRQNACDFVTVMIGTSADEGTKLVAVERVRQLAQIVQRQSDVAIGGAIDTVGRFVKPASQMRVSLHSLPPRTAGVIGNKRLHLQINPGAEKRALDPRSLPCPQPACISTGNAEGEKRRAMLIGSRATDRYRRGFRIAGARGEAGHRLD